MCYTVVPSPGALIESMGWDSSLDDHPENFSLLCDNLQKLIDANQISLYIPQSYLSYLHIFVAENSNPHDANHALHTLLGIGYNIFFEFHSIYEQAITVEHYSCQDNVLFYDILCLLAAIELKAIAILVTKDEKADFLKLIDANPCLRESCPIVVTLEEFINHFCKNLICNKPVDKGLILVHTKEYNISRLKEGSTPIDFAYKIHSYLGNHFEKALVNDKPVPPNHKLQNNDVVVIHTASNNPEHIKESWLQFTNSDTKKLIKRELRKIALERGRHEIKSAINNVQGVTESTLKQILEKIAQEQQYPCPNQLIIAIGQGKIALADIMVNILDYCSHRGVYSHGFLGLEKNPYKICSCCKPLPGDPIVAIVTNDHKSAKIHRADCKHLAQVDPSRCKSITWKDDLWSVKLQIIVQNVPDTMRPVLNTISKFIQAPDFEGLQRFSECRSSGIVRLSVRLENNLTAMLNTVQKMDRVLDIKIREVCLVSNLP